MTELKKKGEQGEKGREIAVGFRDTGNSVP